MLCVSKRCIARAGVLRCLAYLRRRYAVLYLAMPMPMPCLAWLCFAYAYALPNQASLCLGAALLC